MGSQRRPYLLRPPKTNQLADIMALDLERDGTPAGAPQVVASGLGIVEDPRRSPTLASLSVAMSGALAFIQTQISSNLARHSNPCRHHERDGRTTTMGTAQYASPSLSPDGTRLAVFKLTSRGAILGVTGAMGGPFQERGRVTDPGDLAWSPSGRAIAFSATWPDGTSGIGVYRFDSGQIRRFAAGKVGYYLDWLGERVVFQGPGSHDLLIVDPATDQAVTLARGDSATLVFHPKSAPAGDRVAFFVNRAPRNVGVWIRRVADTTWSLVLAGSVKPIRWQASGDTI